MLALRYLQLACAIGVALLGVALWSFSVFQQLFLPSALMDYYGRYRIGSLLFMCDGDYFNTAFEVSWNYGRSQFRVAICAPSPLLTFAGLATTATGLACALRLRPRVRAGLCPACSYDLRATPERCPECGRETTPAERERIRKLHGPADGSGAAGSGPAATAAAVGGGDADPHPGPLPADRERGQSP
jgi:hypothetical protein